MSDFTRTKQSPVKMRCVTKPLGPTAVAEVEIVTKSPNETCSK